VGNLAVTNKVCLHFQFVVPGEVDFETAWPALTGYKIECGNILKDSKITVGIIGEKVVHKILNYYRSNKANRRPSP
jgi:hypothetical protein